MRRARFKPEGRDAFYHLYNRVAGEPGYLPFGPAEKEQFVRLLHKLQTYHTVKVLSYQVMSNHFHLEVFAPGQPPEPEEVCRRYQTYYEGKRKLKPSDPQCTRQGERMRDISCFMHGLQQQFSTWYNRSRPTRRRGGLWAERFKHTLLGEAEALWGCWKYIEMNPYRAGMVEDPADYRFCSYGVWSARGVHPFEQNVCEVLLPELQKKYPFSSTREVYGALKQAFSEARGLRAPEDTDNLRFSTRLDRRVRYWVDGLVIGSELFVREAIQHSRGILRLKAKTVERTDPVDPEPNGLCSYRQLRTG